MCMMLTETISLFECLKNQDKNDSQWNRENILNNYPTEYNEVSNSNRKKRDYYYQTGTKCLLKGNGQKEEKNSTKSFPFVGSSTFHSKNPYQQLAYPGDEIQWNYTGVLEVWFK